MSPCPSAQLEIGSSLCALFQLHMDVSASLALTSVPVWPVPWLSPVLQKFLAIALTKIISCHLWILLPTWGPLSFSARSWLNSLLVFSLSVFVSALDLWRWVFSFLFGWFFVSPVSFFCLPSAVENSDSSASVNDSVHKPLRSWMDMSCFLSLLKQLVGPRMHSA